MAGDFAVDSLLQKSTVHFEVTCQRIVEEESESWHLFTEQVKLIHHFEQYQSVHASVIMIKIASL